MCQNCNNSRFGNWKIFGEEKIVDSFLEAKIFYISICPSAISKTRRGENVNFKATIQEIDDRNLKILFLTIQYLHVHIF